MDNSATNSTTSSRRNTMSKLNQFSNFVKTEFNQCDDALPQELLLGSNNSLSMYYAPFDYVNEQAKVVICGITPGLSQSLVALREAQVALIAGESLESADFRAKHTASFAGAMRKNLVSMLDYLNVNDLLNISTCGDFFGARADLVHYTSAIRYPTFKNGKNYSGSPSMVSDPMLKNVIETVLGPELASFGETTLIIPLGQAVEDALMHLARNGVISEGQILKGIPHPSGANAERIKFFVNEKREQDLSIKTNPAVINARRNHAQQIVSSLMQ
jgi:hypothetical protein